MFNYLRLSICNLHSCVSCGYIMKFMAHESLNVSLKDIDIHFRIIARVNNQMFNRFGTMQFISDNDFGNVSMHRYLLYHIQNGFILVQPHVMIRYCHSLKSNRFGIFEKRIWSPHILQPVHFK